MERLSLHSTCRGVLTVQVMMNMNMGQPCHAGQDRLASIQQALEASREPTHLLMLHCRMSRRQHHKSSLIELSSNDIEVD